MSLADLNLPKNLQKVITDGKSELQDIQNKESGKYVDKDKSTLNDNMKVTPCVCT